MFKKQIEALSKIWPHLQSILPFGLSVKLILGGILTVLGGAGFLGYVSDYATYWYAMNSGFRAPLEGVAYIKAAVTLGSIFLLITCGLIFGVGILLFRYFFLTFLGYGKLLKFVINYIPEKWFRNRVVHFTFKEAMADFLERAQPATMQQRPVKERFIIVLILIAIFFSVASYVIWIKPVGVNVSTGYGIMLYTLVVLVTVYFPNMVWPISFTFTFAYFCLCLFLLFQTNVYAQFLRSVGYGGGYSISISVKDETLRRRLNGVETKLVLRTNDTFILHDYKNESFLEIPQGEVIFVTYGNKEIKLR